MDILCGTGMIQPIQVKLLPCLFFGIIYYMMFYDLQSPWYNIIWKLLNGCGHLWFLPMIFWCFVLMCLIECPSIYQSTNILRYKLTMIAALCFSLINPLMFLPLGIGNAGNFFIYFFTYFFFK